MRNLVSSMLRFSWTLSRLGARQAAGLMSGSQGWDRSAVASFDAVRDAAEESMTPMSRSVFQAGDRLQRVAMDLTCDVARQVFDPPPRQRV